MESQTKPSKLLAYIAVIVGALLMLGGIAALFGYLGGAGARRDFLSAQLGQFAAIYLGLGVGALAVYHGIGSIRGRDSRALKLPPAFLLWIVFALAVGIGNALLEFNIAENFLFPPMFVLGAALPTLAVLAFVLRRLGAPITFRQATLALAAGSTFSIVLTIFLGGILSIAAYFLGFAREINFFRDPLTRLIFSPTVILYLIFVALQAPIPEEFSKALSAILFGRQRITNERQAFAIGLLAGAGFAILENMLYEGVYAMRGGWTWGGVTLLRGIGSVLHPLCTGIVALGWFRMKERGAGELLKAYAVAVGLHTLWNGGFVALVYLSGIEFLTSRASFDVYGMQIRIALVAYLVALSLGLWTLLYRMLTRLAQNIAPDLSPTVISRRALAAFAFACAIVFVPLGAALGPNWGAVQSVALAALSPTPTPTATFTRTLLPTATATRVIPTTTLAPSATATRVIPIATLAPTATATPTFSPTTSPTATPTASPTVSRTATIISTATQSTPTATPSRTVTPTATPNATATAAAQAASALFATASKWRNVFTDDFASNVNGWSVGEFTTDIRSITNGKFRSEAKAGSPFTIIPSPMRGRMVLSDFYASVQVQRTNTSGSAAYGLYFRDTPGSGLYYFSVLNDESFSVRGFQNNQNFSLIPATSSSAIRRGEVNRLTVIAQGVRFTFFINDQYVDEVEDSRFSSGIAGLLVQNLSAAGQPVIEFDNFEVRAP